MDKKTYDAMITAFIAMAQKTDNNGNHIISDMSRNYIADLNCAMNTYEDLDEALKHFREGCAGCWNPLFDKIADDIEAAQSTINEMMNDIIFEISEDLQQ